MLGMSVGSQRKSGIPTKYQPSAVERDHLGTSLSPRARLQTVLEHTAFTGKRTKGQFIRPCRARGSFAQFIPTRSLHVHTRKQRGHNTLNPQLPRACTAPKALTEPSPNPRLPVYDAQLSRNSRYSHSSPPSSGKSVQCTALRTRSMPNCARSDLGLKSVQEAFFRLDAHIAHVHTRMRKKPSGQIRHIRSHTLTRSHAHMLTRSHAHTLTRLSTFASSTPIGP